MITSTTPVNGCKKRKEEQSEKRKVFQYHLCALHFELCASTFCLFIKTMVLSYFIVLCLLNQLNQNQNVKS